MKNLWGEGRLHLRERWAPYSAICIYNKKKKTNGTRRANLVFAVFSFCMLHSPCWYLDNFMAGLCRGSDLGLSHTPWGLGSVKWKVPSALQIHMRTSQEFTNYGGLLEVSFIPTLTLAWQAGSAADSWFLFYLLIPPPPLFFYPLEHNSKSIRNHWGFPWSLDIGRLFKSPHTLFAHFRHPFSPEMIGYQPLRWLFPLLFYIPF